MLAKLCKKKKAVNKFEIMIVELSINGVENINELNDLYDRAVAENLTD